VNDHVRDEFAIFAEFDIGADHTIRAYAAGFGNAG
jgi:hypothetical protein